MDSITLSHFNSDLNAISNLVTSHRQRKQKMNIITKGVSSCDSKIMVIFKHKWFVPGMQDFNFCNTL